MLDFVTVDDFLAGVSSVWRLTGFTRSNTDGGRLYARLSVSAGQTTVDLYKQADRLSADLVATGTGAPGSITLAQSNSSGLSGSLLLSENGSGDGSMLIAYAFDVDLDAYESDLSSILDGAGKYAGEPGFELFTTLAKRRLDEMIISRLRSLGFTDLSDDQYLLALRNPEDLSEPAALLALSLILERLSGAPDLSAAARAGDYRRRFMRELASIHLHFDLLGTGDASLNILMGDVFLRRG